MAEDEGNRDHLQRFREIRDHMQRSWDERNMVCSRISKNYSVKSRTERWLKKRNLMILLNFSVILRWHSCPHITNTSNTKGKRCMYSDCLNSSFKWSK